MSTSDYGAFVEVSDLVSPFVANIEPPIANRVNRKRRVIFLRSEGRRAKHV